MSQQRVIADPAVSVGDIIDVLQKYFRLKGSRDILALLKPMMLQTWKTAPSLQIMCSFCDFYALVFEKSRNGLMSHKKWQQAILATHAIDPCLFTPKILGMEAAVLAAIIRIGASKYRCVKTSDRALQILLQKAFIRKPNSFCSSATQHTTSPHS